MSADELYTKGARVWVPDPEVVWKGALLLEDYKGQKKLKVEYEEDAQEDEIKVESKDKLPPLRNPEILIGENDLTSLSYLHEPAVLHNLQVRFMERSAIYTYCGIVLVAINPYESLPIYGPEIIQAYSGQDQGTMDPHIFAVAEEAFKQMHRFEKNQSIIVSGESGAGKTVSAKFAMRYFASVGGSQTDETQIEKRVLASNPIMEAIGNAKTTRNDNSSRFGKYIEIGFNRQNHIVTANMRTYLLEKSRVVFQAPDERNYHIFYQLCASSELPEFEEFGLRSPEEFWYTSQGENPDVPGVDDAEELVNTREAFKLLGFTDQQQMMIFRVVAGILHFGNVEIKKGDKREELSVVPAKDEAVGYVAKLLGIEEDSIRTWLCCKKIQTAKETLTTPLNVTQAVFARDALTKHIYACMFNWIVTKVNKALVSSAKLHKFIGVLDIYGFETFEINSFEQFCINYANEKLQQQFCLHVFKLEQEEYIREAIEWSMIDFYDNQPCIDLIEAKLGILDLLDEECRMPKGSDENWCRKLYDKHTKAQHFSKPRMSNTAFIVHHFADDVEYQINGFLEKNRDTVYEELLNMLKASTFEFVADLFAAQPEEEAPRKRSRSGAGAVQMRSGREGAKTGSKSNKATVGSQFRMSLNKLMETLFSTTPHYVRCIKPNDDKEAFSFDPQRAVQQLRACGVLETIRISAAGYPSRWTYAEFFQRYRVLATSKDINRKDMRKTCESVLTHYIQDADKFQFGKTKIFFRAGQVAYLEKLRSDKLRACGVMIQKHVRGWLCRRRYTKIRRSVLLLQTYGRGLLARRKALRLRQTAAAITIQKTWRGHHCRQDFLRTRRAVVTIQAFARGFLGRRHFDGILRETRAITIQKFVRGWLARCHYRKIIYGIVKLQSHVRRRRARRLLKELKIEARSVEHIKNVNKGLENKIIQLQQKLDERNKENNVMREEQVKHNQVINELEQLRSKSSETLASTNRIAELEKLVEQLKQELVTEKQEKQDLISEKEQMLHEHEEVITMMIEEKGGLRSQLDEANQRLKVMEQSVDYTVKEKLQLAEADFQSDREHHQKLIKEYARLQQRFENLQGELKVASGQTHMRTSSDVSAISVDTEAGGATEKTEREKDEGYNSVTRLAPHKGSPETNEDMGSGTSSPSEVKHLQNGTVEQTTTKEEKPTEVKEIDVGLLLKLQNRVKDLEREKKRLQAELDRLDSRPRSDSQLSDTAFDTLKMTDLEMENNRLKEDLRKMQKATADESGQAQVMEQFEAMEAELDRRRHECLQLRSLLANRTIDTREVAKESYGGHEEMLNEDGELIMAYKTQKDINKVLERDLQTEKDASKKREQELREQIDELKQDNERQQKLIGQNLTLTPEAKIEATMQHEITRLTAENLDLRESNDKQGETIKKLKKALKIYAKKLKMEEGAFFHQMDSDSASQEESLAIVRHQEREYLGMLEYRKEDEGLVIKNLIGDLKPRLAMQHLPALPAYILFMCIRHTDYMNDDDKVRSLLTNTINGIRKTVKKRHEDVDTISLWLANTLRLLHNLKQYSGEKVFQAENTARQNEHCLRNFDLSEYRQVLSDLGVWIYQGLTKLMQEGIQAMIVPGVLEHEAIAGLSSSKPVGYRGRSASSGEELEAQAHYTLDSLVRMLNHYHSVLTNHAVDPELFKQIFKQLFYAICAGALNNLLLRKEMCNWSKGMQIRYNLSHLEQWVRDHKLQDAGTMDVLEPIIQASQLLQARKTEADVNSICEMCSRLTMPQIIKILNLYTPVDEYEERVPISFIRKIQTQLKSRKDQSNSLLMDTKYTFPVTFPFNPSSISLESIAVPESLNLSFLRRV